MSEARFTKGNWAVTGQSDGGRYIIVKSTTGRTVARVPFSTDKEAEAGAATDASDADLIAAAPAMYEALKKAKRALLSGQPEGISADDVTQYRLDGAICGNALNAIRAALSLAEGK
jgi:hypothetical protein